MDRRALHKQFLQQFPIERLGTMTLEEYTNLDKDNSFCYWLESKTYELGSIWGGSSYKFGIFKYDKAPKQDNSKYSHDENYSWSSRLGNTAEEAFENVRNAIIKIANHAQHAEWNEIDKISELWPITIWKIAFLYSNEKLLPFYDKDGWLVPIAVHFGLTNAKQCSRIELQDYILKQKGNKDLYDFYDELIDMINNSQSNDKRYWMYAPGRKASKWERCQEQGIICIGWDDLGDLSQINSLEDCRDELKNIYNNPDSSFMNDGLAVWEFSHVMQPGDVVYAKQGQNNIIARGIVKSEYRFDSSQEDYCHTREVEWTHIGKWELGNIVQKTLTDITKYPDYVKKIEAMIVDGISISDAGISNYDKKFEPYIKLLLKNKNLIFNGAPGTGKTYMAKQVAAQIIYESNVPEDFEEDAKFIEQCGFVQFHPSYDYTDFVEGLRPTRPNQDGSIGFERKNGIFKAFCREALDGRFIPLEMTISKGSNDEDDRIAKAMVWLMSQNESAVQSVRGNTEYTLVIKQGKIYLRIPKGKENYVNPKAVIRYLKTGEYNKEHQTYEPSVGNFIKENCPLYANDNSNAISNNDYSHIETSETKGTLPYIFIIDEINRGEVSKIFGELFFSIDPGYRGVKGKVQTQYQNLIGDDDPFKEGFYIPKNVYIIGTMNDIDRSVECMDFAMRRRFTFKEITAAESAVNMGLSNEATARMTRLNDAISEIDGFNSSFHIGAAYFCDVEDYDELWDLKLQGLLKEYLRGMPDAEESLDTLRKAYYKSEE